MNRKIAVTGVFLMAFTIAVGAFGAHGLKQIVDAAAVNTFEVGVRYQTYHALALILLAIMPIAETIKKRVLYFFLVGILFFSGSIYLLTLNAFLPFDARIIGFITPIGGLTFIIGWTVLGYHLLRGQKG